MPTAFRKMSFKDARTLLDNLCLLLDGKLASTNKNPSEQPNPSGLEAAWWIENDEKFPPFDGPRCRAYLRAYAEIAGPVFYGSGIPLERGLMHPDRGVMKAMLLAECVTIGVTRRGLFELTPKGCALIEGINLPAEPGAKGS